MQDTRLSAGPTRRGTRIRLQVRHHRTPHWPRRARALALQSSPAATSASAEGSQRQRRLVAPRSKQCAMSPSHMSCHGDLCWALVVVLEARSRPLEWRFGQRQRHLPLRPPLHLHSLIQTPQPLVKRDARLSSCVPRRRSGPTALQHLPPSALVAAQHELSFLRRLRAPLRNCCVYLQWAVL